MTSRGEHIRHVRNLSRMTRAELAAATGVPTKTIARIERNEVASSSSTSLLERHLGIDEPPDSGPLADINDLDLIAELARRLARRRDHNAAAPPLGPPGQYVWDTTDAPFPEDRDSTRREEGVADSGGPA